MRWVFATVAGLRCGSGECHQAIGIGEPYALVAGDLKRCARCVKRTFGVDVPAHVWSEQPQTDVLPTTVQAALAALERRP